MTIYADLTNRVPASSASGSALNFPPFVEGGSVEHSVRFIESVDGSFLERTPAVAAIRASIGIADLRPDGGTYKLRIGTGPSAKTTAAIEWNASAKDIADALNAAGYSKTFATRDSNGTIIIRASDWSSVTIAAEDNLLRPLCSLRLLQEVGDDGHFWTMRPTQYPLAFTDGKLYRLPPGPSLVTIQDGGTDPSGTIEWNEVQELRVPVEFRGTYQLRRGFTQKTELLDGTDGPQEIEAAINKMLESEGATVRVTNPTTGAAHIEFLGPLAGIDVEPLRVHVMTAPPPDLTWILTLNSRRLREVLDANGDEPVTADYEVEVDIYRNADAVEEGTYTVKLWSVPIEIVRTQIWYGMEEISEVDWMRPPDTVSYHPYDFSQVLTGNQQAVVQGLTEGTMHSVPHNFNTPAVNVIVREAATNGRQLRPDEYTVTYPSANEAIIELAEEPASPLIAVVSSIGPASVFTSHTHTIQQIVGLDAILDNLAERVTELESILPSVIVGVPDAAKGTIEIPIPGTTEILFYRGGKKIEIKEGEIKTDLPARGPLMLPAIHTETNDTLLPDPLPDAEIAGSGALWVNYEADPVIIPGGGGIRSSVSEQGGFVGCDGRILYPVSRDAGTNSYFPTPFERELFAFYVSAKMLATRRLELVFGVSLALVNANSRASWVLEIQAGTAPQDMSPATTGPNLQNVLWNATPILRERLVLTQEVVKHEFGLRIKQTLDGMVCDVQNYGLWTGNNDAAPAAPNFAVRARLINFDTENSRPMARGWVFYQLGAAKAEKLKALIT